MENKSNENKFTLSLGNKLLEAEARIKELEVDLNIERSTLNYAKEEIKRKDQLIKEAWVLGRNYEIFEHNTIDLVGWCKTNNIDINNIEL